MSRVLDRLLLAFLGCCLIFCMAAVSFVGLCCWWLAYAGMVFGHTGAFTAFCLLICGTCAYALLRLVMVAGAGLRQAAYLPPALGGGPGL